MNKRWRIGLDFDGVINSYASGYKPGDDGYLPDPPVKGAREFVARLFDIFDEVVIITTRARTKAGVVGIHRWLDKYNFPKNLCVFSEKMPCEIYLDDKAITFRGKFPTKKELVEFRGWTDSDYKYQEETEE